MQKKGWAILKEITTGIFIRDYLVGHKEGYPMEIWRALKEARGSLKTGSYKSFMSNYIWTLKKLQLIQKTRTTSASNPAFYDRVYYRIVIGQEKSRKWSHPQKTLDSRRSLGSKKYKKKSAG